MEQHSFQSDSSVSVCSFCSARLLQAWRPCSKPGSHGLKISLPPVTAFIIIPCVPHDRNSVVWLPPKQFVCYDSKRAPGKSWPDLREWKKLNIRVCREQSSSRSRDRFLQIFFIHTLLKVTTSPGRINSLISWLVADKNTFFSKDILIKSIQFHWCRLG